MVLEDERLKKAVLLVLSNKQDIPGAVSTAELSGILGLTERRRETAWLIQVVIMTLMMVVVMLVVVLVLMTGKGKFHSGDKCNRRRGPF